MIRTFLLCGLLVAPHAAVAVERCPKPDATFDRFLAQFISDTTFQRSRIILPLVYRYGSYSLKDPEIQLWDIQKVKKLESPLILSGPQRMERDIVQKMPIKTKDYVEVFHGKSEADSYRILFKFRNLEGCWYLEELHETSL